MTELVIGTGPVSVIFKPRSSQSQSSDPSGSPFCWKRQGRFSTEILSSRSCVALMMSFASTVSTTATAIIARSSSISSPPRHPFSSAPSTPSCPLQGLVLRANLSNPGVGEPSSSYISLMIKSMVACDGIS